MRRGFISLLFSSAFVAAGLGFSFPLLDFSMNRMGASASMIGINAAMPALGWLIVTPLLPRLQRTIGARRLLVIFLATAIGAMIAFHVFPNIWLWIPIRFLFGGSLGLFFRVIEFWVNSDANQAVRGRNIGVYAALFCAGAAAGSALVPVVGSSGWIPHLFVCALIACGALPLFANKTPIPEITAPPSHSLGSFVFLLPVAMIGILVWGMLESVPYSFMPIYALRVGFTEEWAALTVTAVVIGALIFPIPLGMLADRMDKRKLVLACGVVAFTLTLLLPQTLASIELFLFSLFLWEGFAGGLYTVSLAIIGARFDGSNLAAANAAFGTLYAFGAMVGPIFNGMAMDTWPPDGLMYGAAALFALFIINAAWNLTRKAAPLEEGPP